jgi:hypothetical protein
VLSNSMSTGASGTVDGYPLTLRVVHEGARPATVPLSAPSENLKSTALSSCSKAPRHYFRRPIFQAFDPSTGRSGLAEERDGLRPSSGAPNRT